MRCDQSGSLVPLTMRRLSESSAVRIVAVAVVKVCCRVASSASACTTSIGAIVPTSTRILLSESSFDASASDCFAHVDGLDGKDVVPIRAAHGGQRIRRARLQIQLGVVAADECRLDLLARLVDPEAAQQRLRVAEQVASC